MRYHWRVNLRYFYKRAIIKYIIADRRIIIKEAERRITCNMKQTNFRARQISFNELFLRKLKLLGNVFKC